MQLGRNPTKPSRLLVRYGQARGKRRHLPFLRTRYTNPLTHAKSAYGKSDPRQSPRKASASAQREPASAHLTIPSATETVMADITFPGTVRLPSLRRLRATNHYRGEAGAKGGKTPSVRGCRQRGPIVEAGSGSHSAFHGPAPTRTR